jgi:hypothetical protein
LWLAKYRDGLFAVTLSPQGVIFKAFFADEERESAFPSSENGSRRAQALSHGPVADTVT